MRIAWLVLCAAVLSGCVTSLNARMVSPNDSGRYSDDIVDVSFLFVPSPTLPGNPLSDKKVVGATFKLTNKSSRPLRILWDESSLILDGKSMRVIHYAIRPRCRPLYQTELP